MLSRHQLDTHLQKSAMASVHAQCNHADRNRTPNLFWSGRATQNRVQQTWWKQISARNTGKGTWAKMKTKRCPWCSDCCRTVYCNPRHDHGTLLGHWIAYIEPCKETIWSVYGTPPPPDSSKHMSLLIWNTCSIRGALDNILTSVRFSLWGKTCSPRYEFVSSS